MIMNEVTERRRSNEDGAKMEMSSLRKYVTEIEQFQRKPVQRKCRQAEMQSSIAGCEFVVFCLRERRAVFLFHSNAQV